MGRTWIRKALPAEHPLGCPDVVHVPNGCDPPRPGLFGPESRHCLAGHQPFHLGLPSSDLLAGRCEGCPGNEILVGRASASAGEQVDEGGHAGGLVAAKLLEIPPNSVFDRRCIGV